MKNLKSNLAIFVVALFCYYNTTFAGQEKQYYIDNFKTAKEHGSEIFSQSRTWYSFGGIHIRAVSNSLHATGNSPTWSGFGIDPGPYGNNGAPINTNGFNTILVDVKGNASGLKLELYDEQYVKYELWIDLANISQGLYQQELPSKLHGKKIAKLQFLCAPGDIDIEITSISLK